MNLNENFYREIKTIRPECNGGKISKFTLKFRVKNFLQNYENSMENIIEFSKKISRNSWWNFKELSGNIFGHRTTHLTELFARTVWIHVMYVV